MIKPKLEQITSETTSKEFYNLNCIDCIHDSNKDADPVCRMLNQVIEKRKVNILKCEKYKQKRWKQC